MCMSVLPDMCTLVPRATLMPMLQLLATCNTLTLQIKGKCNATNLMFPFGQGQHHDVALEGDISFLWSYTTFFWSSFLYRGL